MTTPRVWRASDAARAEVLIEFAGAGDDEASREQARRLTHDNLLAQLKAAGRSQLGPVEWREYDPDAAPTMLRGAGFGSDPRAAGLVEFLTIAPSVLVVATVCCTGVES